MIDELIDIYFRYQTAIVIMIGLSTVFLFNHALERRKKRYLYCIVILDFLLMICEVIKADVFNPSITAIYLRITVDIIAHVIRPSLIVYFFVLISNNSTRKFRLQFFTPLALDILVLLSAYFCGACFYYETDASGTYMVNGPLFFFPFLVNVGYLLMLVIESITYFKKGGGRTSFAVIYSAILAVLGVIIEGTHPEKKVIVNFTMITTLIYFMMFYFNTMMNQQVEINRQLKIEMMYSQIGHHFIFNTLSAIYGLVDKDPKKAKQAIDHFSNYLRGNIDAIGKNSPIPFEEELKHIEAYTWIEKMRIGDDLTVELDTKVTDFRVPVLSVQPLVENAIKHGIHKKNAPGKLTIRTSETPEAYIVEVIDDGVGFDVEEVCGESILSGEDLISNSKKDDSNYEQKDGLQSNALENGAAQNTSNSGQKGNTQTLSPEDYAELAKMDKERREKKRRINPFRVDVSDRRGVPEREHVGLLNVRKRLMADNFGDLTIDSKPGVGTHARIRIFKSAEDIYPD